MPFVYTHFRFGIKCLEKLPSDLVSIIKENIDSYIYGCQGPDIFYYYNLLKDNDVKKYGEKLHEQSMKQTLSQFNLKLQKSKERDALLSYILGYISHFVLDSYCNSYIYKAEKEKSISKRIIINELDKYYYYKDKINISKFNLSNYFKPSKKLVSNIGYLYNNFNENTYKKIIYDFKTKLFLLNENNDYKKDILSYFYKLSGNNEYASYLKDDISKECLPFSIRCDKYFEIAVYHYQKLVLNYIESIIKNTELDQYFKHNLVNKDNIDIKVLDIENEEKYIIYNYQD